MGLWAGHSPDSPSLSSRLTPSASPAVKGRRRSPVCVAQDLSLLAPPSTGDTQPTWAPDTPASHLL